MDNLSIMQGLDAAIKIIRKTRRENASGSLTIWRILMRAEGHLDAQIAELLKPEAQDQPAAKRRNVMAEGKRIEREAEERERIGNAPTCDECGERHNPEQDCPDGPEAARCSVCGGSVAVEDGKLECHLNSSDEVCTGGR